MVAVDICNLALGYLGDSATVSSIDPPEGSAQAQHCARFYPMAVALLLEAHEWNFITKRVALALLETPYNDRWRYAYAMPADANAILSVIPQGCYVSFPNWSYWDRPFVFEMDERKRWLDFQREVDGKNRQVILSNVCDAIARYASSQVQPGMFSALFTDALAWKLASMLAGPLLKGDVGAAESKRCLQMSALILSQAMVQDANQKHDAPRPTPVWIGDR